VGVYTLYKKGTRKKKRKEGNQETKTRKTHQRKKERKKKKNERKKQNKQKQTHNNNKKLARQTGRSLKVRSSKCEVPIKANSKFDVILFDWRLLMLIYKHTHPQSQREKGRKRQADTKKK
jgi:hypothetical protein